MRKSPAPRRLKGATAVVEGKKRKEGKILMACPDLSEALLGYCNTSPLQALHTPRGAFDGKDRGEGRLESRRYRLTRKAAGRRDPVNEKQMCSRGNKNGM